MEENTVTRREVLRILGIELPVILLSVDSLSGSAFGESYTKKTFKVNGQRLLDMMNNPSLFISYGPQTDSAGKTTGAVILDMSEEVSSVASSKAVTWRPGMVIHKVNGKPFIPKSNEDLLETMVQVKKSVESKVPLEIDLELDGKPYKYVFQYE
jgi:hypothetical protein